MVYKDKNGTVWNLEVHSQSESEKSEESVTSKDDLFPSQPKNFDGQNCKENGLIFSESGSSINPKDLKNKKNLSKSKDKKQQVEGKQ